MNFRSKLIKSIKRKQKNFEFKGFSLNRHKQNDFGKLQDKRGAVAHSREDNRHSELQASEFNGEVVKDVSILRHYRAFPNLKELTVSDRDLGYIAESSQRFPKLKELTISGRVNDENFSALMTLLSKIPNLEILNIDSVRLSSQNLSELHKFDKSTSLDPNKVANDLQKLSLADRTKGKKLLNIKEKQHKFKFTEYIGKDTKKLEELSKILLGNLGYLTDIDLSGTGLELLPESIGNCKHVKVLNISGNPINHLPESIGNLADLGELNLSGLKNLGGLPDTIQNLKNLRVLDIRGCYNATFWKQKLEKLKAKNKNLKIITE